MPYQYLNEFNDPLGPEWDLDNYGESANFFLADGLFYVGSNDGSYVSADLSLSLPRYWEMVVEIVDVPPPSTWEAYLEDSINGNYFDATIQEDLDFPTGYKLRGMISNSSTAFDDVPHDPLPTHWLRYKLEQEGELKRASIAISLDNSTWEELSTTTNDESTGFIWTPDGDPFRDVRLYLTSNSLDPVGIGSIVFNELPPTPPTLHPFVASAYDLQGNAQDSALIEIQDYVSHDPAKVWAEYEDEWWIEDLSTLRTNANGLFVGWLAAGLYRFRSTVGAFTSDWEPFELQD